MPDWVQENQAMTLLAIVLAASLSFFLGLVVGSEVEASRDIKVQKYGAIALRIALAIAAVAAISMIVVGTRASLLS